MDVSYSPSEEAFRQQVEAWLRENQPDGWTETELRDLPEADAHEIRKQWTKKLSDGGWLGIALPEELGGRSASLVEQVIFQDVMFHADAPKSLAAGLSHMASTISELGTLEQKEQWLGPMLRGETIWYQGFSEPNAGSDLAGLQTRAELDGDEWVVTGQKLWGNPRGAHWGGVLARTDPDAPKHRGISYLVVDMTSPGIQVGQVKDMAGADHLGEAYFDNVRIPRENVIGEVNDGWRVANRTLVYERGVITMSFATQYLRWWEEIRDLAREVTRDGVPLIEDPCLRERLGQAYLDVTLMRLTNLRYLTQYERGAPPGLESSYMKLLWATANQSVADLAMSVAGRESLLMPDAEGAVGDGRWTYEYFFSRAVTIYGGTQDIQRNLIAERIFGLPRGN